MSFKKAEKKNAKLRLALSGVSGSGKTYTALQMAHQFGSRVAVIDSERESASLYSDVFPFDTSEEPPTTIGDYLREIQDAAAAGYEVLVIDSYSHSWMDALDKIDKGGGWTRAGKSVSPEVQKLVNAILSFPGHVIATFRSKTEYAVEKDEKTGKTGMRKVGLAPVARPDTEYEFTVWLEVNRDGAITVSKTRCSALNEGIYNRDTDVPKIAKILKSWLNSGKELTPVESMAERIKFCTSIEALNAVSEEIRTMTATPEEKAKLRPVFQAKAAELSQAAAGEDEP